MNTVEREDRVQYRTAHVLPSTVRLAVDNVSHTTTVLPVGGSTCTSDAVATVVFAYDLHTNAAMSTSTCTWYDYSFQWIALTSMGSHDLRSADLYTCMHTEYIK